MHAKHILLHHLIVPLLDLIQSPYHGIIVALVAECPLHVHQQVPHRDVLALVQHAGPFAWVPTETGEDVECILASSYCLRKASTSKRQSVYVTSAPRSVDLKIGISNLAGQPFPLPTPSAVSVPMLAAHSLNCSGVSIRVWHPPVWGRGG